MNDNLNEIKKIVKEIISYEGIPSGDIPDIALYMDQVTTFMDKKLSGFKRSEKDKILTKTMINNYTRTNLVFPPINKKYEKEHIMLLTIIYHLKQILSVNDMVKLLDPVINYVEKPGDSENKSKAADEMYGLFTEMESEQLGIFENSIENLLQSLAGKTELKDISDNDNPFLILFVITLIIQAERRKNLAEKLIDRFFVQDAPEKKKEDDKPKDKSKNTSKKK